MATIEEIEERVARLERIEEDRQLDAALRAQSFGINLVQSEVVAIRADLVALDAKVDGLAAKVDANHAELNGKLDAILARLDRG
jgi:hypothetical protein